MKCFLFFLLVSSPFLSPLLSSPLYSPLFPSTPLSSPLLSSPLLSSPLLSSPLLSSPLLSSPLLSSAVRFGPPFLMREDRSISWDQLQQSLLSKLYYLMLNGSQAQVMAAPSVSCVLSPSALGFMNLLVALWLNSKSHKEKSVRWWFDSF